ncbi:hypothetical protein KY284_016391 [Solanum tuberosum]|nr:hypothetical protein KY284_016391 [Solanum tuberosum]
MAAMWISLPRLSPDLFTKRSLLSMASAVGRPITIDKAKQNKTRPSTVRVKVILNLRDKLPKRMRLQYLDEETGKIQEVFQEFVYDNLPLYCNHCKHQGHDENGCRLILKKNQDNNRKDNGVVGDEQFNGEKFQVILNCPLATVSQTLVLGAKDGATSDSVVPMINLKSDLVSNPKLSTAGVLCGKDSSLATIQDSGQANKVQQCEKNLDRISKSGGTCDHDFTLKDNDKGGWTEVPSKTFSLGNTKLQQLDCTNPTHKEQTVNCEDKVSRKNNQGVTINTSNHDVPNSPSLESLGEQIFGQQSISKRNDKGLGKETSDSRWVDLVEKEEHISAPAKNKLSPHEAPIFVPSSKTNPSMVVTIDNSKKILTITTKVLEKSHEPEAGVSRLSPTTTYDSDLGSEKFDDDEMRDILFDKVAKDGDLSPRQQRSGSNKNKNKTHERQHIWDDKVIEEFIPRHLPM